ncbi:ATP-dependent helicase DinG [Rhodoferax lithotrophicus]|uniref:ATP-dependent DNA helicase DinG n=1 Tax=Rhodoferax lithotrophicus TaxID=2798804 RepID=A0ABN6D5H0_9BURK|nr:ATP-dependent DNA helicase DinG [Rhodoferax sp. MIZ03]BCO27245.1 ATP-dependent helicase DinG [Rhodoferax sp. MIZ03]
MKKPDLTSVALQAFDQMVAATPGFRSRLGQRHMAERIASTLHDVDLGEHDEPHSAVTVIQAGTGVGKSAAYLSTTVAMALARKTRVVVSTATVALQEQLMSKDLPALAAVLDTPFVFALAKGRGRYVCKLKLERLAGSDGEPLDMFEGDEDAPVPAPPKAAKPTKGGVWQDPQERRMQMYDTLASSLATGKWDGDRDSLAEQPEASDWATVAAERHTCTARHCPRFGTCSYYQARMQLAQAQVIVANHDLVLASLGMKALPDLDNCLVVFDEGHHLPAVALDQFSSAMDLSGLRWLDKLPKILLEVAEKMGFVLVQDVTTLAQQLKTALLEASRLAMEFLRGVASSYDVVHRFKEGVVPEVMLEPFKLIHGHASALSDALEALGKELKLRAKEDPSQAAHCSVQYAKLGQLAPKINSVVATSAQWLTESEPPLAKWLKSDTSSGLVQLSAHACPIVPGDLLRQHLWQQVRGAVVTSASLTTCGSFDYFLAETGLAGLPQVSTLAVDSPFDYRTQGQLIVADTRADARQVDAYTAEVVAALLADLRDVPRGALVLFTSRVQMQAAVNALDARLEDIVLVQGQMARGKLLGIHQARIEAGAASVIFGLQSFGEGLDLPGALCETVFITKLPFSPPSDPVEEARADWLKRSGRDPFSELVVPATGIKLLQWTGRAIRSETDQARVICYDKRLLSMAYGRRMLQGLPPYAVSRRSNPR